MTTKRTYKILSAIGEETPQGNVAFEQLERFVNEHISKGWLPLGSITISAVVGPSRMLKKSLH